MLAVLEIGSQCGVWVCFKVASQQLLTTTSTTATTHFKAWFKPHHLLLTLHTFCRSLSDSAWPVHILPEEAGSRCSIIGSNVLTLHGRIEGSRVGKLEIYNPTDNNEPLVTWDHDKIRRTGKLGRLLFIEIGRRCKGGPGLVWIYMGTSDKIAFELRDTLRRYLSKIVATPVDSYSTAFLYSQLFHFVHFFTIS